MILVTGASGFLGSHLVRHLSGKGQKVRALYYSNPPGNGLKDLQGTEWMRCDLLDVFDVEDAMQDITHVYHCAAIVSFDPRKRDEMLHFNVESTINIVNNALICGVDKLIYISSVAAIGRPVDPKKEITEEETWGESKFNSAYGISKYLAETEVWRGIGEGLNAVIVNPGIILGAGNWKDGSAALMNVAYKEFPFYTTGITSWVDVADVVKAVCLLMDAELTSERLILSAGNFAFRDVFTLMAKALNKKPPRIRANALLTGIAWRWYLLRSYLGGGALLVTKETSNTAHANSLYNNEKLLKLFPEFNYCNLEHTIALMAESFLNATEKK